jgi:hypothetical protein
MTRFQIPAAVALAFLMLAPEATAQVLGGAARGGVRGAVVGGLVGGSSGAATGARVGAVVGTARAVGAEAQARAQYQTSAAYQGTPRSNFYQAPPQVLVTAPPAAATAPPAAATAPPAAATAPPAAATSAGGETVLRKDGSPVAGITFPADWRLATGDRYISGVSADGQAYSMVAALEGAADKQAGIAKVKQGLGQYLQDIKFDEPTETKRGALVITGTGKGKKSGVDVVFAAGVFDAGARQIVGVAFVVDARIEEHYKETVHQICQTIRVGDDLATKK